MHLSDLSRLLDVALLNGPNIFMLTVTDAPQGMGRLHRFLQGACGAGRRNGLPLSEIQLCLDRFPNVPSRLFGARITDSGHPEVLRLIYASSEGTRA